MKSLTGAAASELFCNVITDCDVQLNINELLFYGFPSRVNIRIFQKLFWSRNVYRFRGRKELRCRMSFVTLLCPGFSSRWLSAVWNLLPERKGGGRKRRIFEGSIQLLFQSSVSTIQFANFVFSNFSSFTQLLYFTSSRSRATSSFNCKFSISRFLWIRFSSLLASAVSF